MENSKKRFCKLCFDSSRYTQIWKIYCVRLKPQISISDSISVPVPTAIPVLVLIQCFSIFCQILISGWEKWWFYSGPGGRERGVNCQDQTLKFLSNKIIELFLQKNDYLKNHDICIYAIHNQNLGILLATSLILKEGWNTCKSSSQPSDSDSVAHRTRNPFFLQFYIIGNTVRKKL